MELSFTNLEKALEIIRAAIEALAETIESPNVDAAIVRLEGAPEGILNNQLLLENIADPNNPWPKSWEFTPSGGDSVIVTDSTGRVIGTIYEDRIEADGRTESGQRGNTILNRFPLVADMTYSVDGFEYDTDDSGRVVETTGELQEEARIRLESQQGKAVNLKDGLETDQGGHIIAARFFGPGEQINYYPMDAELNLSAWKIMENTWAGAVEDGQEVFVQIEAIYTDDDSRPEEFIVKYTIDGQPFKEEFENGN